MSKYIIITHLCKTNVLPLGFASFPEDIQLHDVGDTVTRLCDIVHNKYALCNREL